MRIILYFIILTFLVPFSGYAKNDAKRFDQWVKSFKRSAQKKGYSKKFLDLAFIDVQFSETVVLRDRKQYPPKKISFEEQIKWFMTIEDSDFGTRYEKGFSLLKEHSKLFDDIENKFSVNREVLVALWGVESLYGKYMGIYPVIQSLSTLGFKSKRSKFFKKELYSALQILQKGHVSQEKFLGSWAGALGQCQFMPSNFFIYTFDYDGDGKNDIWFNTGDALSSMANYLKKVGYKQDAPVGFMINIPKNFHRKYYSKRVKKSLEEWQKLGITIWGEGEFPKIDKNFKANIIRPGHGIPPMLAFENYKVILRWNRSHLFTAKIISMMQYFQLLSQKS